jgi:hypothetical protein
MIDVFIPIIVGNISKLPAALYSVLTQNYDGDIRIILFFDHIHKLLEDFADKWWYTSQDNSRTNLVERLHPTVSKPLTIEYCTRGVIVRNPNGPMGSAGFARQWIFEWEGKSEYVKFLDSDDILTPECLQHMMNAITPDCAGVICPLYLVSSCRNARTFGAGAGSGSFLFKKEIMEHIVKKGFTWNRRPGHDRSFTNFLRENNYKFNSLKENMLYIYMKS